MSPFDKLIHLIDYSPNQLDLNKYLVRYYQALLLYRLSFEEYQEDFISEVILNKAEYIFLIKAALLGQLSKSEKALLNKIEAQEYPFKLNFLNTFKLYLMIEEQIKKESNLLKDPHFERVHKKLDDVFKSLKQQPDAKIGEIANKEFSFVAVDNSNETVSNIFIYIGVILTFSCILAVLFTFYEDISNQPLVMGLTSGAIYAIATLLIAKNKTKKELKNIKQSKSIYPLYLNSFFNNLRQSY